MGVFPAPVPLMQITYAIWFHSENDRFGIRPVVWVHFVLELLHASHTAIWEKKLYVDTRADTQILQNGYSFIFNEIIRQKQSLCNSN